MLVILIGFIYTANQLGYRELVGNYADLYYLYSYFSSLTDNIVVLTDFQSPEKSALFIEAIKQDILPESIFSFDRLLFRKDHILIYNNISDLEKVLSRSDDEVFVYFSGHCSEGNIILPDGKLDTLLFRQKIEKVNVGSEIFLIFDCCHADGTRLPFVWNGNAYVLSQKAHFTTRKTVCLCSTKQEEDSASKIGGSVFTHCFLNQIHEGKDDDLSTLVTKVNEECGCYPQTATLYTSLPNLKKIWPWLYKKEKSESF